MARNIAAVFIALIAAYFALAIAGTLQAAVDSSRTYEGVSGLVLLRLISTVPFLVAAAVLGVVAALIARPVSRGAWLVLIGILGVAVFAAQQRYVAPELWAWLETILSAAVVGAVAVCAFWLIARRQKAVPSRLHAKGIDRD